MRLRVTGTVLLAVAASACSMDNQMLGRIYVSPGRYEYYRCPEIASSIAADVKREQELVEVMERANQAPSGAVVNAFVYNSQLATTREELRQLHEVSAQKNCNTPAHALPAPSDAPSRR
jgi:hypothetical protein